MKIAVFAAIGLLSGCAIDGVYATPHGLSATPDPPPFDYAAAQQKIAERMNARMNLLVGLNIHMAVEMFGYPDTSREVVGDRVYSWQYAQRFPSPGGEPLTLACNIQIGTDQSDTIKSARWEGNGCAHYAQTQ